MNWTKQQARAIELKGKNILVAAAAGSGKTAVLVERIKRLILQDRCPIDRMLIVTFTNAAASEMKEKIEKAINQTIRETENKDDLVFLKKQLDLLPAANISTFHAFALEVIRRYFYIIDVEPNFKICDESQQTILRGQAMDQLLEEKFEEGSAAFYDFMNKFSGDRNNEKVREMIEKAFDTIQSLPEPYEWLDQAAAGLGADFETFMKSPVMEYMWQDVSRRLDVAVEGLAENIRWAEAHRMDGYLELANMDMAIAAGLKEIVAEGPTAFDKFRQVLEEVKLPSMIKKYTDPAKNPDADQAALDEAKYYMTAGRAALKDLASGAEGSMRKTYFYDTAANIHAEVLATAEDGLYFAGLIKEFDRLYAEKKAEKGLVDFSDIEHFAYRILKDEEASAFYRNKFEHIFIDEYQDSNVLQEALIGTIRRENNLFMVGDVKQSIYKFRLAEPEIFQGKYRDYARQMEAGGEASLSEKIDLNQNFRSKKPVIDFINRVFEDTMPDYDENAALYVGDPYGDRSDYAPKLFLAQTAWNEDDEPDEELKMIIKAEKEALAAAKIIRGALGKPFFDSKKGVERPLEKKDIVILMRGVRSYGDVFYRILTENNLPAYVDDNDGFFDTIEINTFMALLAIIDNKKQDIPLLTVMRSEILGYSIEELAAIRLNSREGSYYNAVEACAAGGEGVPSELVEKCRETLKKVESWQQMSIILPLEELVWQIMLDTGFYIAMGAMPAGSQRQANLRALVDKALGYRQNQDGSLYGFMKYIDAVKEKKVPMGQVKMLGEDDDTIRIMTIHKSKGLEFPMVLLAGFCRRLNYTKTGKGAAIHKDFGIGLPLVNYSESWYKNTIIQNVIKNKFRSEESEEEKRILYVALTRAKDILAILGTLDDVPAEVQNVLDKAPDDSSYFTMTGRTICRIPGAKQEIFNTELLGISRGRKRAAGRALQLLSAGPGPVSPDIMSRLTFAYPYEAELGIKSKYSVSELAAQSHAAGNLTLAEPASFKVSAGFTPAQIGTFTHKVLEQMDFAQAAAGGELYMNSLIDALVCGEFLTAEEAAAVDMAKLVDFARSSLGARMAASPAVYREKPFNLVYNIDGIDTMVQGIIDCFFEEDDQLVLVDYKTTNIRTQEELDRRKAEITGRYALQMEIYRKALESITGKKVKQSNLYLTNMGATIKM